MSYRNWSIGDVGWVWPEDVDETGCENRSASRSIRVMHTPLDGKPWRVAEVLVDECDAQMMDDCRLVAAAPDLLAALAETKDELVSLYERIYPNEKRDEHIFAVIARATAVIHKASDKEDE